MISLFLFGVLSFTFAQETTKTPKEKAVHKSTGVNKDGTQDKRLKQNKVKAVQPQATVQPVVTTKPRPSKPQPAVQPVITPKPQPTAQPVVTPKPRPSKPQPAVQPVITPKPQPTVQPVVSPTPNVKVADKAVGTDAKGRTIYEGLRGGKYYINQKGNKEYIKKG